jgi:sugar phosphate isomerase/epimerase
MKLGFITSILDGWNFDEVVDVAQEMGYKCLEVACWPNGKAERRYAGVCHIDVANLTDADAQHIKSRCAETGIEISSLAYYPNTLAPGAAGEAAREHLGKVIDASARLGVNMVTTFIGRDQTKTVEENFELVEKYWRDIIKHAEDKGVKIAIENCPMLFGRDQWPGGQNLFTSPANWRRIFEILPSENLGINFDPSHFVLQMMDYTKPLYEFKDKIFHIHCKDMRIYKERLDEYGTFAYPETYMEPKLPGLGQVDWGKYFSALGDIRYDSFVCVEVEDRAFEGSRERILDSLRLSKKYLEQYCI